MGESGPINPPCQTPYFKEDNMKRSKHSLSYYNLLTMDMGTLVPCGLTEVLPGDTIQHATSLLLRATPLLAPVMHPVRVRVHHWFVPHRLVWDEWEDFITGGPDGDNASVHPTVIPSRTPFGALDYYGIPLGYGGEVSALPSRGYNLIFNEWYRDQDLVNTRVTSKASGLDNTTDLSLARASWEKDYFTTARPWTQKGPDVSLPLAIQAPVIRDPATDGEPTFSGTGFTGQKLMSETGTNAINHQGTATGTGGVAWSNPKLVADLTSASAVNINELRRAFALQRYEEARARYGSRYTEYLRYLGVKSSDARLQRPEYLGGGKATIQFSEVLQTGPDVDGEGLADLKGHGIAAMRSNRYRRFFEEHGFVHSFISVLPKTIYEQNIVRHFLRKYKEDYFQKELQHIGQQEITNREIYAAAASPDGVFGYQDRYDEYRRSPSMVNGEFRNVYNYWHFARQFAGQPVLNEAFISADPTKRVFAEQTQNSLLVMANHNIQARRMVASSGTSYIF
ncbi:MAG: major capsid protein [Arizlama microvirus]|nr:MAG: major capsid protein [Arizlama microvirus]